MWVGYSLFWGGGGGVGDCRVRAHVPCPSVLRAMCVRVTSPCATGSVNPGAICSTPGLASVMWRTLDASRAINRAHVVI